MGLIKDIKDIEPISNNQFNITKDDLIRDLKGFPLGVVVRMLEEAELQGNKANVKVFQSWYNTNALHGGFDWTETKNGYVFWYLVLDKKSIDEFYDKYPEYKKYDD